MRRHLAPGAGSAAAQVRGTQSLALSSRDRPVDSHAPRYATKDHGGVDSQVLASGRDLHPVVRDLCDPRLLLVTLGGEDPKDASDDRRFRSRP
jgi:hypothetical protein